MAGILDELEVTPEDQEMEQSQMAVEVPNEPDPEPEQAPEQPPEPVGAAQAEEPTQDQGEGEEELPQPPEKMVNYGALTEERAKRRELEAQIQKMEERFSQFQERITNPPAPEPEIPAYDEDPGEHLRQRLERTEQAASTLLEQRQAQEASLQEQQALREWAGRFQQNENEFAQSHADYYDAANYLRDSRIAEYKAVGWDEAGAQAQILKETVELGLDAERRGISAAERFYELAKVRGYQPGNGTAPTEGSTRQPNLEQIERNMGKAKSLGPSGSSPRPTTLADLADMDDDSFDKATDGDAWAKMWS